MKLIGRLSKAIFVASAIFLAGNLIAADALPKLDLKPAYPNLRFSRPLAMVEAPDGSHREFLIEQAGRIWILPADHNGSDPKLFLDISGRDIYVDDEEGLLSLAFHPQFKSNGKFYIWYSHPSYPKHTILAELQVSKTDPNKADLKSERVLLNINKPGEWNHNGGTLLFGPDNDLYLSIGDGGAGYDPNDFGQQLNNLFGKIIRIDVDSRTAGLQYGIPKDNPFVDVAKQDQLKADPTDMKANVTRQEIFAYGVRNPWRMSFDRETGELWAGEVGQDLWEEVNIIKKGGNYGWSAREGFHELHQYNGPDHKVRGSAPIDPILEYAHNTMIQPESKFPNHSIGMSLTGGYVYRGNKIPALRGVYVYGDYMMGTIWGLRYENGKVTADDTLVPANSQRHISSFAEDSAGELYVLAFDGNIYDLVEAGK